MTTPTNPSPVNPTPVLWHASIHSTQDLLTHLEPLIVASNRVPACANEHGPGRRDAATGHPGEGAIRRAGDGLSCLARLSERIGLRWNAYPQSRMCSACAASWALQVARNHLIDARHEEIPPKPATTKATKERP